MDDLDRTCTEGCGCQGTKTASECKEDPWCYVCEQWAFAYEADLGAADDVSRETSEGAER